MKNFSKILGILLTVGGSASANGTLFEGVVKLSAYNSTSGQTDSTPFITATGTRTRPGVIAVSRDLKQYYGKSVYIDKVYGCGVPANYFAGRRFVAEDAMNSRFFRKIDVWTYTRSEAYRIGNCTALIRITK